MSQHPTFVDLFSGAGGLSLGLQQAGWHPLLAVDNWRDAITTYEANFRGHRSWLADLTDASNVSAPSLATHLPDRPDWIVGGPPCQGFSTVGKRERSDARNGLVRAFRNAVEALKPEGFLIENVVGLKDMRFDYEVRTMFQDLGYRVSSLVLRAADYGVPQLRRRIVFVGHRRRGYFLGPTVTHTPHQFMTVWNAIGDLPEVLPGQEVVEYDRLPFTDYQREMRRASVSLQGHVVSRHPPGLVRAISFIPDGGNRRAIPDELQPSSGFHNSYSRLNSKAPAVAVTSNMGKPSGTRCIHPFQHRGLTAREGARLQSFPDTFLFYGGLVSQRLQIANAVPPRLGNALGLALEDSQRWGAEPPVLYPRPLPFDEIEDVPELPLLAYASGARR